MWLPSGGTLVIDRTEAMTVIDVNTGKFTGSGGNLEETVTRNNLEAAEEIVRQLRLRDIGGIIVIDFIDMVLEANRDLVLRRLTECLARDRTRHQVAEVTSLGLVQMTRKRVGGGLLEHFSTPCEHCRGRGVIVDTEAIEHAEPGKPEAGGGRKARGGRGRRGDGETNGHHGNGRSVNGSGGGSDTGSVGDHAAVVAATAVIAAAGNRSGGAVATARRRLAVGESRRSRRRDAEVAAGCAGGRRRGAPPGRSVADLRARRDARAAGSAPVRPRRRPGRLAGCGAQRSGSRRRSARLRRSRHPATPLGSAGSAPAARRGACGGCRAAAAPRRRRDGGVSTRHAHARTRWPTVPRNRRPRVVAVAGSPAPRAHRPSPRARRLPRPSSRCRVRGVGHHAERRFRGRRPPTSPHPRWRRSRSPPPRPGPAGPAGRRPVRPGRPSEVPAESAGGDPV